MRARQTRRFLLRADPARLVGFNRDLVLERASPQLRRLLDDVELHDVEQVTADSVVVALGLPPAIVDDDVVPVLREVLGIGPGGYERMPGMDQVKGVGGEAPICPCGGVDGHHLPGCRYA